MFSQASRLFPYAKLPTRLQIPIVSMYLSIDRSMLVNCNYRVSHISGTSVRPRRTCELFVQRKSPIHGLRPKEIYMVQLMMLSVVCFFLGLHIGLDSQVTLYSYICICFWARPLGWTWSTRLSCWAAWTMNLGFRVGRLRKIELDTGCMLTGRNVSDSTGYYKPNIFRHVLEDSERTTWIQLK